MISRNYSSLQNAGNKASTGGLPYFHTEKVQTQTPPQPTKCNLPTRLKGTIATLALTLPRACSPASVTPPAPLFFTLMPGLFAKMMVKAPAHQAPKNRQEWDSTPSDGLDECKLSFSRYSIFLRDGGFLRIRGMYSHAFLGQESPSCLSLTTCH